MPHGSRIERSDDSEVPRELTPTISVWIGAGANVFAKVISLGGSVFDNTVPTPSAWPWSANHDHWFSSNALANEDLVSVLDGAESLSLTRKYPGESPSQISSGLKKDATGCVDDWRCQFSTTNVIYPSPNLWVSGPFAPDPNLTGFFFVEDAPSDPLHAKLFIEIDPNDKGKIARVTWLTEERHAGFNRSLELKAAAIPSPWSSAWYHLSES